MGGMGPSGLNPTTVLRNDISIESPSGSENLTMFFTRKKLAVVQANIVIQGSSSPSVTWNIKWAADRDDGTPTSLFSSDQTTSSTSGEEKTSFDNDKIPIDRWVWLETSSSSGTPTEIAVTLEYILD